MDSTSKDLQRLRESCISNLDYYNEDTPAIINKTRKYILPAFLSYGKDFLKAIGEFTFIAIGIEDQERSELYTDNTVGFLIDAKKSRSLDFKKLGVAYVDDYFFGEILYGQLHMLILKLPDFYGDTVIKEFKLGNYSKMYENPKDLVYNNYKGSFLKSVKDDVLKILTKEPKKREELESNLSIGGSIITIPEQAELDSIYEPREEIFNYGRKIEVI